MEYNSKIWDTYTTENKDGSQPELSKFIYHIALGLNAKKICEAGCNVGNNLTEFPNGMEVHGIDMNESALDKARKKYTSFTFKKANLNKIPYPDSYFDLVFTRGVLIHINQKELDNTMNELFRISKRWILNLEYFGEDGKMIKWKRGDDLLWYRNMKERWEGFDVEIISDVEIPTNIDSGRTWLTLVRKK
jgi:hypothetical protein